VNDYLPGQRVIVHDPLRRRDYRGVIVHSTQPDTRGTAQVTEGWVVRWVDDLGRAHETHRWPHELTPAAQVLGDTARIVWAARRAGAHLAEDRVRHGVRRRRWVAAGIGVDLIVTTEATR
jgi:hypothetical protein